MSFTPHQIIEQANRFQDEPFLYSVELYSRAHDLLILSLWQPNGYNFEAGETCYQTLWFRSPQFVRLPTSFSFAEFTLAAGEALPGEASHKPLTVDIRASAYLRKAAIKRDFQVVCEGVEIGALPKRMRWHDYVEPSGYPLTLAPEGARAPYLLGKRFKWIRCEFIYPGGERTIFLSGETEAGEYLTLSLMALSYLEMPLLMHDVVVDHPSLEEMRQVVARAGFTYEVRESDFEGPGGHDLRFESAEGCYYLLTGGRDDVLLFERREELAAFVDAEVRYSSMDFYLKMYSLEE